MPVELPDDFFTLAALTTFGGSTLVVTVVTTALVKGLGLPALRTAFVCSLCTAGAGSSLISSDDHIALRILLAFINGCLLFCTATGLHEYTTAEKKSTSGKTQGSEKTSWRDAWRRSWLK